MSGWDDLYKNDHWIKVSNRPALEITVNWISALHECGVKRVYDMGCGLGRHTILLAKQGFSVVASDVSSRALESTEQKLKAAKLQGRVVRADMSSIPFPDEHFDAILAIAVMEHNTRAEIEKTISKIFRSLRPGGLVLASFLPRTRWIRRDDAELDMVEDNTLRSYGPENTIHHMVDEAELRELFRMFLVQSIDRQEEEFDGCKSAELFILVQKPEV